MPPVYTCWVRFQNSCSHADSFPCSEVCFRAAVSDLFSRALLAVDPKRRNDGRHGGLSVSGPVTAGSGGLSLCAARNPPRFTSDGRLIDEIGNRRDPINYEDIPKHLIDALMQQKMCASTLTPGSISRA